MENIVEQVREGLTVKVQGLETALQYVRDPAEFERMKKDLEGARAALTKLDEKDERTEEEVAAIAKMVDDVVSMESSDAPWSSLTPQEKFKYQVSLYRDKLKQTLQQVSSQASTLAAVVVHMSKTQGEADFMDNIIKQFDNSLSEVLFSEKQIEAQLELEESAMALVDDVDFFAKLELLNKFLNNPMNLPHLSEEREAKLKELHANEEG